MHTLIELPVSDHEQLHVKLEDNRMFLTLHSHGCPAYLVNSVEEAVDFVHPADSLASKTNQVINLLCEISAELTKYNNTANHE